LGADGGEDTFTLATFNTLAQVYVKRSFFPYAKHEALREGPRRANLVRQVAALKADVLCLQEVDSYTEFWAPLLTRLGYTAEYKRKTDGKRDGVVVAWSNATFVRAPAPAAPRAVEFDSFPECLPTLEEAATEDMPRKTGCVALAVPLVSKRSNRRLTVATTHIVWRWRLPRLQAAQVSRAAALAHTVAETNDRSAVVLAGDFNSTAGTQPYATACNAGLASVHDSWPQQARGAGVTTVTATFRGWIDHVFFSNNSLALAAVAEIPDETEFTAETALPDSTHGSDHVPLLMQFALRH